MDYSLELTKDSATPKQAIQIAEIILEDKELLTILKSNLKEEKDES